jgi:hypothetical protein
MRLSWVAGAAIAALLTLLAPGASAQAEMGRITGTLQTESGTTIANAVVVARSAQTGMTRKTKSSASGVYTIPSLRAGVYEVHVEAEGLEKAMLQVRVSVGSTSRLDFTLYPVQKQPAEP